MNKPQSASGSKIARLSAARLSAVQAVYQMMTNDQSAKSVVDDYIIGGRLGQPVDGAAMVAPDRELFSRLVSGVGEKRVELEGFIRAAQEGKSKTVAEPLLQSILLCGTYELFAIRETDTPVIISDYLNVTHAFYDQGEAKLVNGILDKIRSAVRE